MAQYKCDACDDLRDDQICWKCGRETHAVDLPNTLEKVAAKIARPSIEPAKKPVPRPPTSPNSPANSPGPSSSPAATAPRAAAAPKTSPSPAVTSNPTPRTSAPTPSSDPAQQRPNPAAQSPLRPAPFASPATAIRGLDEFEALLTQRKMQAVVICGDSATGKSEIVAGFIRARVVYRGEAQLLTLRAPDRNQNALGGTMKDEIWYQVVDDKLAFLDPSGEFFKQLSPDERKKFGLPDVTEEKFDFVKKAVANLAGIVLVVDLTRMLGANDYSAWKRQEEDLNFIITALRFLRFDKETRPAQIEMTVNMAQRVSMFPRIDKPVLVLFSKADQLTHLTNGSPLELARTRLPTLHGALMTHASRYRYDFCHTMIKTAQGDAAADHPCGVLLPMEWLLRNRLHRLPLQLPTRSIGGGR